MYEIGYLKNLDKFLNYYEDKEYYLSQDFINIIRESGGNNIERLLIIPMITSDYELNLFSYDYAEYKVPKDPYNKLAISIYYNFPCEEYNTLNILDSIRLYDTYGYSEIIYPVMEWGSSKDYKNIINHFNHMNKNFIDKGFPIMIGEVGILNDYIKKIILLILLNNCYIVYFQCHMSIKEFYLVYGIFLLYLQLIKIFISIKRVVNGLMINTKKFLIKYPKESL
jgi:hypothetical protein